MSIDYVIISSIILLIIWGILFYIFVKSGGLSAALAGILIALQTFGYISILYFNLIYYIGSWFVIILVLIYLSSREDRGTFLFFYGICVISFFISLTLYWTPSSLGTFTNTWLIIIILLSTFFLYFSGVRLEDEKNDDFIGAAVIFDIFFIICYIAFNLVFFIWFPVTYIQYVWNILGISLSILILLIIIPIQLPIFRSKDNSLKIYSIFFMILSVCLSIIGMLAGFFTNISLFVILWVFIFLSNLNGTVNKKTYLISLISFGINFIMFIISFCMFWITDFIAFFIFLGILIPFTLITSITVLKFL